MPFALARKEERMTLPTRLEGDVRVTLGVDTHAEVHVAVALDQLGRRLGIRSAPATPAGSAQLLGWASQFGPVEGAGVEGTGSWGVGLARFLRAQGVAVIEVNRPSRHGRRRTGKSDPVDAEAAARAVQAGTATAQAKSADGQVEMLRTLRLTRRSAVKARTQAANQLQSLVVTAPDELRGQLRGLSLARLIQVAARLRPGRQPATTLAASKLALRSIAVRYQQLSEEIAVLDQQLDRLVKLAAPALVAVPGVGTDTAVALLVAAGDNPDRLHSEAAFAHLCGVAPIPASSGKVTRHRLHRGGNRDANRALWVITLSWMRWDARTRAYVARRTAEGKSKLEIIRCLIGEVSAGDLHPGGSWRLGRRLGTAPMPCHPDGQFEFCRPGRTEAGDRHQGYARSRAKQ
jgi:transposase